MVDMGSLIEAVIYDGGSRPVALPPDARTVLLPVGLSVLPLAGGLARRGRSGAERTVRRGWILRERIAELARRISADRRALYVSGETFGGPGHPGGSRLAGRPGGARPAGDLRHRG